MKPYLKKTVADLVDVLEQIQGLLKVVLVCSSVVVAHVQLWTDTGGFYWCL